MDLGDVTGRQELGRRIQSAIMESGHASLSAFAGKLGCSRALIYQYVNGDVLVQLDRLQSIAQLTCKSLDWFLLPDPQANSNVTEQLEKRLDNAESTLSRAHAELAAERGARLQQEQLHRQTVLELLRNLCLAHRYCGDAQAMVEVGMRWVAAAEAAGDARMAMDAQLQLGHAWFISGELARAQSQLEAALKAAVELADERAEMSARQELTRTLQASGRTIEARQQAEHVAAAHRWWPRWSGLLSLVALAEQTGALEEAERFIEAAQSVIEEPDAPEQHRALAKAYLLSNRVNLLIARGRFRKALATNSKLRSLAELASLPDQMREATLNAALCYLRLGKIEAAAHQLDRVREWTALEPDLHAELLADVLGSQLLLARGDVKGAKKLARNCTERAAEAGRGHLLTEAELALGRVFLAEQRPDDASYQFHKCRDRARRLDLKKLQMSAELGLLCASLAANTPIPHGSAAKLVSTCAELRYEDLVAEADQLLSSQSRHAGGGMQQQCRDQ